MFVFRSCLLCYWFLFASQISWWIPFEKDKDTLCPVDLRPGITRRLSRNFLTWRSFPKGSSSFGLAQVLDGEKLSKEITLWIFAVSGGLDSEPGKDTALHHFVVGLVGLQAFWTKTLGVCPNVRDSKIPPLIGVSPDVRIVIWSLSLVCRRISTSKVDLTITLQHPWLWHLKGRLGRPLQSEKLKVIRHLTVFHAQSHSYIQPGHRNPSPK